MLLMIRAFSTRHPAMAFIPGVRPICHCPYWRYDCSSLQTGTAYLIAVFVIRMFNPSRYYGCTTLLTIYAVRHLPYYFAVYRLARGLPLHAAKIAVFISRWSGAQYCNNASRSRNSQRENATQRPLDAPRHFPPSLRHRRKAENAPPRHAQHSGRVRLIWFSFSSGN